MAGGYGAPAPDPANRPMGPKPIKGPKRNPMGCIGGIGLLSILIAVAIMAVLWSRAADDVTSSPVPTELAPPQSAIAPEAGGAATPAQGGSVGAAGAASCGTERTTIETAMQVFEVTTGTRPTSVEDLVTAGLVVPDGELSFQIDPAGVLTGTGACTGS